MSALKQKNMLRFIIGGPQSEKINSKLQGNKLVDVRYDFIGSIPHARVVEEMQRSHVVLILSEFEGIPNVLYEAMSTGNCVIATNVGGVSEIIHHRVNGFLIPPNDPAALLDAIDKISATPNIVYNLARQARNDIISCSYDRFVENYVDIYSHLVLTSVKC